MLKYIIFLCLSPFILLSESNIRDAFKKYNFEAQIQLFHYSIDKDSNKNAYATALGGYLKYTTDSYHNTFASFKLYTSNPVGDNHNKIYTSMFNNDKDGDSLHAIGESYIAYKTFSGLIRVGNVILNTPMMNEDTTRIVPWSYQGVTYKNSINKETEVQVYYINKIRSNTSSEYKKESACGEIGNSGITVAALQYIGMPGVHIQSFYYYAPELYSTFVGQIDYEYINSFNTLVCLGLQYFKSDNGGKHANTESSYGGDDINLVALRALIDAEEWKISINYSKNYGESGVIKGYGGLAKVYTTSMIANGRGKFQPETWMMKSTYNLPFNSHDSEIALRLTHTEVHDINGHDFFAYYLHFKHFFNADTSIFLRYENINYLTDVGDAQFFRVIAKYKF